MTDDVDAIMHVMRAAFDDRYGEAWNRRQVGDAIVMPNTHHLILHDPEKSRGEPIGFVMSRQGADEEELLLIAIHPAHRGRGHGSRLLAEFFSQARARNVSRVFLEMREGNPAEHLYRAAGFREVGVRPGYYRGAVGGPLNAITYAIEL